MQGADDPERKQKDKHGQDCKNDCPDRERSDSGYDTYDQSHDKNNIPYVTEPRDR